MWVGLVDVVGVVGCDFNKQWATLKHGDPIDEGEVRSDREVENKRWVDALKLTVTVEQDLQESRTRQAEIDEERASAFPKPLSQERQREIETKIKELRKVEPSHNGWEKLNSTQRKCYISYHPDKISKFGRKTQVAAPRRVRSRMYQRENSAEDGESFSR